MKRHFIAHVLVSVYPRAWRSEYGDELELMLAGRPLTTCVICNVVGHGLLQRLRVAPVWAIAGAVLALKLIVGTTANSISPLTTHEYRWFFSIPDNAIAFAVGYFALIRDRKSIRSAMGSAALASTVGMIPEVILALLWAAHVIHLNILGMDGTPYIAGRGVVDLCARGQINGPADLLCGLLLLAMPVGAILASIVGLLGCVIAKTSEGRKRRLTTL